VITPWRTLGEQLDAAIDAQWAEPIRIVPQQQDGGADLSRPAVLTNGVYSPPMENTGRYDADYLSKCIGSDWIDMNAFSISPNLVVVDQNQTALIRLLEKHGLDVIPLKLRHSKLLGGGPHCVTLDIRRSGSLERYFD
jgi:hypothetical protein